jgi:hypothetical protein
VADCSEHRQAAGVVAEALNGNLHSLALIAFSGKAAGMRTDGFAFIPQTVPRPQYALYTTPSTQQRQGVGTAWEAGPDEKRFLRGSGYICVQNWSYRDFRPMLLSGDATDARGGSR